MSAVDIAFWITLSATLLADGMLLATIAVPSIQMWPPPGGRRTWQYRATWTFFAVFAAGLLVVGGLDAGNLGLSRWIGTAGTLILGSLLVIGGTAFASYAMGYLGLRGCLGLDAELVTDGPFAVSRNPGYLGDLVLLAGYVVLTDSTLAAILAGAGAVWFVLAPWAEEPWLDAQYGNAYRRYKARTPRFFRFTS